jgi:hypothetical protein
VKGEHVRSVRDFPGVIVAPFGGVVDVFLGRGL